MAAAAGMPTSVTSGTNAGLASAGTGKSFLLETLYLWCIVNGFRAEACAPTGIAAARIHVPRTPVRAYTVHNMFALIVDLESQTDPSKPDDEKKKRAGHAAGCESGRAYRRDRGRPARHDGLPGVDSGTNLAKG